MTDRSTQVEETPARQGQTGTGMRWVLRISLVLIVVAFAVIWAVYAGPLSGHGGQASAPPNTVKEASATAAPGSVPAPGREERTTGG